MQARMVPTAKVLPYPGNPRTPRGAVAKVAASLQEFGFQQPIVVDTGMVIIVGHTRHAAALQLGIKQVPVVVADQLGEAEARAYRIADNRTGAEAEFDRPMLQAEIAGLKLADYAVDKLGFDPAELTSLMATEQTGASPDSYAPVIAYNLFFETAADQETWFSFLRYLKAEMTQETITGRITEFARERGFLAR